MSQSYFISKANFLRLFESIKGLYTVKDEPVYKYSIPELEDEDRSMILQVKLFLSDPSELSKVLPGITRVDDFRFMEAPSPPAYHSAGNCDHLLNAFQNISLPPSLAGNQELVQQCRTSFQMICKRLLDSYIDKPDWREIQEKAIPLFINHLRSGEHLRSMFNAAGVSVDGLTKMMFPLVSKNNSGSTKLQFIEGKIDAVYKAFKDESTHSIKSKGLKSVQRCKTEAINIFRRGHRSQLIELLIEFHIAALNPELRFELEVLKTLGFIPCSNCNGESFFEPSYLADTVDPIEDYLSRILQLYNLIQCFGEVWFKNDPKQPLSGIDVIKEAGEGLYYCTNKATGVIQAVYKMDSGGWIYIPAPTDKSGKVIELPRHWLWKVELKHLSSTIHSVKQDALLLPIDRL